MDWSAIAVSVADHAQVGLFVLDTAGVVRVLNGPAERALGRVRAAVVGRCWEELFDPVARATIGATVRAAQNGVAGRVALPFAELALHPLAGDAGAVVALLEPTHGVPWMAIDAAGDFGRIREVHGEGTPDDVGGRCYAVLAGRDRRCEGCPVPEHAGAGTGVTVLADGRVMITRARRGDGDTADVHHDFLPRETAARLAREQLAALATRHQLSDREREVLVLLARGKTVEAIGAALGITPRTAKFHQANVLAKLGLTSRVELISLLVT